MQADTIRERGTLHFRGTYVERSHAVPADYCAGKRRDWTVCPGNMSARSCADSCAWEYVLVHELSSDSCPRLYGLPSARAAPLCLELHARARVDLWQNVSENETAWYMKIQGINGAGHHLEWVVRMADEERHVYQCFKAIEVRFRCSSSYVYGVSLASIRTESHIVQVHPRQRGMGQPPLFWSWPSQALRAYCTGWSQSLTLSLGGASAFAYRL